MIRRGEEPLIKAVVNVANEPVASTANSGLNAWQTMIKNNTIKITHPALECSLEDVLKFQEGYVNCRSSKENYLRHYTNKPNYNIQLETVIKTIMIKANLGTKNKTELDIMKAAIREMRECLKLVLDHSEKFKCYASKEFNDSFLLKNTKLAIRTKYKASGKAKSGNGVGEDGTYERFTQELLGGWIQRMKDAKTLWPNWYHHYLDEEEKVQRGEAVFNELDNLILVVEAYLEKLKDQSEHNKEALTRTEGRKPIAKYTDFEIRRGMPTRTARHKQSEDTKNMYSKIDLLLKEMEEDSDYTCFTVTDEVMGITTHCNVDARSQRRRFLADCRVEW
jgi:hypothetical protein